MEIPKIKYPEVTEALKSRNIWTMLKFFGPGAIIASLTIGSGETLFASRGGAVFGYSLIWAFLISAIMKGVQVYTGMRYMTLTGEHPMERWAHLPGPRAWFPLVIAIPSLICFPFIVSGLATLLGILTKWIVGFGNPYYWGLLFIAGTVEQPLVGADDVFDDVEGLVPSLAGQAHLAHPLAGLGGDCRPRRGG